MSQTYKLIIDKEGVNHVKVFKAEGDGYTNHWNFPLTGDEDPIVFSEFYNETQFVVMNWNGWLRAYDAADKTLLFEIDFKGNIDVKAVLSLDKTKLYIAFRNESNHNCLVQLTLDAIKVETFELPDILGKSLQIRKDGNLLFYRTDSERINNTKVFRHFYSVLDVTSFDVTEYELAFAPQYAFNDFIPVVDIKNNRVIMPANGEVVSKTTETGETVFDYRLAIFDATTFEMQRVLSVRDFQKNQLSYYPNECDTIAELFLGTVRDKNYMKALREFYESLNTIKVSSEGIWLCWSGGIIRRIHTDFSLSPLLVTASMPNNSGEGMFMFPNFHAHLYYIDNRTIVLAEALDFYSTVFPTISNADINTPIALNFESTTPEAVFNMHYSKEQADAIKNQDLVKIQVEDLSTKESFEDALNQIQTIVSDLTGAGIGSTLQFIFQDTKGKILEEPMFFATAAQQDAASVQKIILNCIQYPKVKYLYRNPCETVLCHAVSELAKQDEKYLPTIIKYLAAIDMDHDVFNTENLIPLLEERYTYKALAKKIKTISKEFSEWYEFYCEEMHEE